MLFVFTGNNFQKRDLAVEKLLDVLKQKRPEAEFNSFNSENFTVNTINQMSAQSGLFESKTINKFFNLTEEKENQKTLINSVKQLKESANAFVLVEEKINKALLDSLEKEKVEIKDFSQNKMNSDKNPFEIANFILSNQNQKAWKKYQELKLSKYADEEIFGIIWWQLKSLLLSMQYSQKESGLKPFVYNKCLQNHSKWEKEYLKEALFNLLSSYHNSRRGRESFNLFFEKAILDLNK